MQIQVDIQKDAFSLSLSRSYQNEPEHKITFVRIIQVAHLLKMHIENIATANQLTLISLHHLAHGIAFHRMKFNANRIIYKRKKLSSQLHANEPTSGCLRTAFPIKSHLSSFLVKCICTFHVPLVLPGIRSIHIASI